MYQYHKSNLFDLKATMVPTSELKPPKSVNNYQIGQVKTITLTNLLYYLLYFTLLLFITLSITLLRNSKVPQHTSHTIALHSDL